MSTRNENSILKSGYLIKFAKIKDTKERLKAIRKRYFELDGNTLTYYKDHKSLQTPQGNLLLIAGSTVEYYKIDKIDQFEFAIIVSTPFQSVVLAAKTKDDMASWKYAISHAIDFAQTALRGYMIKKGSSFLEGSPRKFFVLWNDVLSFHADHEHTAMTQWSIEIDRETILKADDFKLLLYVSDGLENVTIQFEKKSANEYLIWKEAILDNITKFNKVFEQEMFEVEQALEAAITNGQLRIRPDFGGEDWPEFLVALTEDELIMIESIENEEHFRIVERYKMHLGSKISETILMDNSFQLVTPNKILHFAAESDELRTFWMNSILELVQTSSPPEHDISDVLHREALAKITLDSYYDVTFEELKPLGLVLEKSGEWAVVKISNFKDTGVKIGSALCAINGVSVMNSHYQEIVDALKDWTPPLTLTFRMAPEKFGYLNKKVNTSKEHPKWRDRYFMLSEGKFSYKQTDSDHSGIRDGMPLMGAVVTLIPPGEYNNKFFCFQIMSGVKCFIMEASNVEELKEWASMLYHAISIANGASYIISYEAKKFEEEEEKHLLLERMRQEKYNAESAEVLQRLELAVESKNIEDLEQALNETLSRGIKGDYITFAMSVLETAKLELKQREEDEKIFHEAAEAAALEEEKLKRLDEELNELRDEQYSSQVDLEDDETKQVAVESLTATFASRFVMSTTRQKKPRKGSIVMSIEVEEDEEDVQESVAITGTIEDPSTLFHIEPASMEELRVLFQTYVKRSNEGADYINVMQFSSIYRLVTGEKGNLYSEMQMFNKFDCDGKGFMVEADFVSGWLNLAMERKNDTYLKKIRFVLGDNNVLL